jgi:hypothetical protein
MQQFPISSVDRNIDELGETSRLNSRADVQHYVESLILKFGGEKTWSPELEGLKLRLIDAEFASISDESKTVSEELMASAFNGLMDRWKAPEQTHITTEELRVFRLILAHLVNPKSALRLSDGRLSSRARPVEAVHVICLLAARGGIPPAIRQAMKNREWVLGLEDSRTVLRRATAQLSPVAPVHGQVMLDYIAARSKYFSTRSLGDVAKDFRKVLSVLGI